MNIHYELLNNGSPSVLKGKINALTQYLPQGMYCALKDKLKNGTVLVLYHS